LAFAFGLPAGFAGALPAIAAKQAAIIAAARAVLQTLSIVHFLFPVTTVRVVVVRLHKLTAIREVSAASEMLELLQDAGRSGRPASSGKMDRWRG